MTTETTDRDMDMLWTYPRRERENSETIPFRWLLFSFFFFFKHQYSSLFGDGSVRFSTDMDTLMFGYKPLSLLLCGGAFISRQRPATIWLRPRMHPWAQRDLSAPLHQHGRLFGICWQTASSGANCRVNTGPQRESAVSDAALDLINQ